MRIPGLLLMLLFATGAQASAERYIQLSMHMVKILAAAPDGRINSGTGVQLNAFGVAGVFESGDTKWRHTNLWPHQRTTNPLHWPTLCLQIIFGL